MATFGCVATHRGLQMLSLEERVDEWYYFLTLKCPYGSIGCIWLANTHPTCTDLIRNHRKKWQYVGRAKVSTQNAFQRAGPSKWDWLVVFQQSCSITTLVDAITTAWEH